MSEMRKTIQEVYVAYNTFGQTTHNVCIRRVSRGGDRTEQWYGVWRKVTESSLNRLHRVLQSIQIRAGIGGEWTVGCGVYKQGMYIYLRR